ncbi:MAG: purine-binding chemotaxis protein CheW [Rhizobiales bacterium]|nr:purine-binding chemotaxis protein CheW [Hyphomicrobiales bacterium]
MALGDLYGAGGEDRCQYVSFIVAGCYYGIDITRVREIKGWSAPTALPNAAGAMLGVLNLRGVVVPVFDLCRRFGRGNTEVTEAHVVIIVSLEDRLIGILVDAVSDILTLGAKDILPVPRTEADVNQDFLAGLVSQGERMVTLLNLDSLFEIGG